jgi:phosphatidylserine/phosphatidylglycerophosphate/cardiolipin synthase-like enzyme
VERDQFLATLLVAMVIAVLALSFGSEWFSQTQWNPFGQSASTSTSASNTVTAFQTVTVTGICGGDVEILEICYSPGGNCAAVIQKYWDRANKTIFVAIYSFTLYNLADSLTRAKIRGVVVQVVFDQAQMAIQGSQYLYLKESGISVRIDRSVNLMHDKFTVIDGTIVITGSFNFSRSAVESNRENLIVIRSVLVAKQYEEQFTVIWNESGD